MGILNVTPDSFSDGGRYMAISAAMTRVQQMLDAGVDIVDVGGESTRPGATRISLEEEADRVLPVIEQIKERFDTIVSIDTYKEALARQAVEEAGADMINDISALTFSDSMAQTIAALDVPVILMHIQGTPENMQQQPFYTDAIREIHDYLSDRVEYAIENGVKRDKILLDPGIGFGKRLEDNIVIIRELGQFCDFDLPIVIGLSRKAFLGALSGETIAANRDAETLAANTIACLHGASVVRVHDVAATVKALRVLKRLMPPKQ